MSSYQFFASNTPLKEYENPKISLETGLLYSTADESCGMRIILEDDADIRKSYTPLMYSAYIEWDYSDKNAEIMMTYIKEHLQNAPGIQLWNVWLGDKSTTQKKRISLDKLKTQHILEIWGKGFSGNVECLEIYKIRKG